MTPQALKHNKEYSVPNKCIYWTVGKRTLDLKVELDWVKYEGGGLTLPPDELGTSKDWRFQLSETALTGTFYASWSLRRVKDKLGQIDIINEKIAPFAEEEN